MPKITEREEYIRQLALKSFLENISDEDVKYILNKIDTPILESFLRKKKLDKINSYMNNQDD